MASVVGGAFSFVAARLDSGCGSVEMTRIGETAAEQEQLGMSPSDSTTSVDEAQVESAAMQQIQQLRIKLMEADDEESFAASLKQVYSLWRFVGGNIFDSSFRGKRTWSLL